MTSGKTTSVRGLWRVRWLVGVAAAGGILALVLLAGPLRARASGTPLLPNLAAEPPTEPEIQTRSLEGSNHLLLRFTGYINNVGRGALDMKGSRSEPTLSSPGEAEFKKWKEHKSEDPVLPPKLAEELAKPPMQVTQQLFTTEVEHEETNINRPRVEEPSAAVMIYSDADGHNHWHLQHIARYSLWNAARTAEVAPSQKVGFCLLDSEHIDSYGPTKAVYSNAVRGEFCDQFEPQAANLREGISRGWRDKYEKELAFQWVDISNVQPGEYWLREDVDPEGVVKEEPGLKEPAYSKGLVTIPGVVAQSQSVNTPVGKPIAVTLTSKGYGGANAPTYNIASGPSHGGLSPISGNKLTYTPAPGYEGYDEFTFSARQQHAEFPNNRGTPTAEIATVSITVGTPPQPGLTITSAPSGMTAGTSATVSAAATNYSGNIEWSTSAGSVAPATGQSVTFTAPASVPAGGAATLTARLASDPAVSVSRAIAISPQPADEPAPELPKTGTEPPKGGVAGEKSGTTPKPTYLTRPRAMMVGRELVVTTTPKLAGTVGVSAYFGKKQLGHCSAHTPANRRFTCRITLRSARFARERLKIVASLHVGHHVYLATLGPAVIGQMRMSPALRLRGVASLATVSKLAYWCSPSTLIETVGDGEE